MRLTWRAGRMVAGLMAMLACAQPGLAGDARTPETQRIEFFSGSGLTGNSMFGYVGGAWAFGRSVNEPGLRLKLLAGMGGYDYDSSLPGVAGRVAFDGDVSLLHMLAGYQWRRGEWTLKAYAGIAHEDHDLSPADPGNAVTGRETGVIGQIELWRNLGASRWLSLDASYTDVFDSYRTQVRLGRRVTPRFSAGIEAGVLGNAEYDSVRGGAFVRTHMGALDLTLSGGVTGEHYTGDAGGYAAFGVYRKF